MPVLDHPTHEKTVGGERYGCYDRKRSRRCYYGKDGFHGDGRQKFILCKTEMSTECRYDQSLTDAKCCGCKHSGSGEAYAQGVRANGA